MNDLKLSQYFIFSLLLCLTFYSCKKEMNEPDLCENIACLNGGFCENGTCNCPEGFTGDNCEIEVIVDPCAGIECLNEGICEDGACDCPEGFTGEFCEIEIDTCETQLCLSSRISMTDLGFEGELIRSMDTYEQYIILKTHNDLFIRVDKNNLTPFLLADVSGTVNDYSISPDGHLSVGTMTEGIYIYDMDGTLLTHLDQTNSCLPSNNVSAVAVYDQESLYFGCFTPLFDENTEGEYMEGYGLLKTNYLGDQCNEWTTSNSGIEGNLIQDIDLAESGQVWVATQNRRFKWYLERKDTIAINILTDDQSISSIYERYSIQEMQKLQVVDEQTIWFRFIQVANEMIGTTYAGAELNLDGELIGSNHNLFTITTIYAAYNAVGDKFELGTSFTQPDEYTFDNFIFLNHSKDGVTTFYNDRIGELLQEDGIGIREISVTSDNEVWMATQSFIYQLDFPE